MCIYRITPALFLFFLVGILGTSCSPKVVEEGIGSFYADKFSGRKTASGEVFRQRKKTAAHRSLPFGTKVKVINTRNGRQVRVRINDRGPFVPGRVIDLSRKAARRLHMVQDGVVPVKLVYKQNKNKKR